MDLDRATYWLAPINHKHFLGPFQYLNDESRGSRSVPGPLPPHGRCRTKRVKLTRWGRVKTTKSRCSNRPHGIQSTCAAPGCAWLHQLAPAGLNSNLLILPAKIQPNPRCTKWSCLSSKLPLIVLYAHSGPQAVGEISAEHQALVTTDLIELAVEGRVMFWIVLVLETPANVKANNNHPDQPNSSANWSFPWN